MRNRTTFTPARRRAVYLVVRILFLPGSCATDLGVTLSDIRVYFFCLTVKSSHIKSLTRLVLYTFSVLLVYKFLLLLFGWHEPQAQTQLSVFKWRQSKPRANVLIIVRIT